MAKKRRKKEEYQGFEQGPIRPPSEANSLLIRITRNCPWNQCTFCPVYKDQRFSVRPVAHVLQDIDAVHRQVQLMQQTADEAGRLRREQIKNIADSNHPTDMQAFYAALNWVIGGMKSIFLQDANSLIIKPPDLIRILKHLRACFPWVERITSYARSHTIARISDENLSEMEKAGLNRIHIGLESGSDEVLKRVLKGVSKATQVKAGRKVKAAGMELSEYVMPGLGGSVLSEIHAKETADALNQIDPDFIRLRSLAIPDHVPLNRAYQNDEFEKCNDIEMASEILTFIEDLDGITSYVKSDHILNLFQEVEGRLPEDKPLMMKPIEDFLAMDSEQQTLYIVGRRLGVFSSLNDMESPRRLNRAEKACRELGITPDNRDGIVEELMKRFI
ncbi:MAG: radical SAM protein [Deltaproteobacteria bacterium]|jgi:uncharacterized protein YifN (PemK superfamily)|nr:radical SAM protein [Deltaproteobacteria bacterium]